MKKYLPVVLLLTVTSLPAHAYIDPGSGSYLIQILAALFLGSLFTIKTFWYRIKNFFSKNKDNQNDD